MRQLDLFGSLFNPPPSEEKPEEEKPVVKKEEKAQVKEVKPATSIEAPAIEEKPKTYYSIVEVAEDYRDFSNQIAAAPAEAKLEKKDTAKKTEPSNKAIEPQASKTVLQPLKVEKQVELVAEIKEPPAVKPKKEEARKQENIIVQPEIVVVKIDDTNVVEGEVIAEEALATVEEPIFDVGDIKVIEKKKPQARKAKTLKAPELETNGAIVFSDGKIAVKIKNKNPFAEVTSEKEKVEKKEKVKKIPQKRGRKSFKEIDAEVDLIEIPDDEVLFQKQYYPISEVAKWFRVNTSLLRFWENEFEVLKPRKNRKGDRLFRPEDVKNLQLIYQLLRQKKYTVEGAKEYLKSNKKKADIQLQLTNTLQKFRGFLLDMKANLQL